MLGQRLSSGTLYRCGTKADYLSPAAPVIRGLETVPSSPESQKINPLTEQPSQQTFNSKNMSKRSAKNETTKKTSTLASRKKSVRGKKASRQGNVFEIQDLKSARDKKKLTQKRKKEPEICKEQENSVVNLEINTEPTS